MERHNEKNTSFIVSLLVDDISTVAACDCYFQTALQMTGCWHCDNVRITKERKKKWSKLSMGRQEDRCLLGFGDFCSCVRVCVKTAWACECVQSCLRAHMGNHVCWA